VVTETHERFYSDLADTSTVNLVVQTDNP
jgi:hypothetical protein